MVYLPREDSFLLALCVSEYAKGKTVLDMCAGSGIQALSAIKAGAKSVLATDIEKESVEIMKKAGINAIQSDLCANIEGKFDLIVCNPPYLPLDKRESSESSLATTGGDKGDEIACRFINGAAEHLNDDGKILLLISSLTPRDSINHLLVKNNLAKKVIKSEHFFMETLEVWLLERVFKSPNP